MLHFYPHPLSPYSQKIYFLLEESNTMFDLHVISLEKRENRRSAYAELNPAGRVPAIKDGDLALSESNAILRYLVRRLNFSDLYPVGLKDQAEVDLWWEYTSHHINKPLMDLIWHKTMVSDFGGRPDFHVIARAERELARDLPVLENHLQSRNYLATAFLTLADINLMPFAHNAYKVLPLDQWPSFKRWIDFVGQRQAWRNVVATF